MTSDAEPCRRRSTIPHSRPSTHSGLSREPTAWVWARSSGERLDTIRSRFSFDAFYERHERGEIGVTEYFASLRTSLGIDLSDDEFAQGWGAIYIREVPGIVDLLRSVGKRVPLYAF